MGVRSGGGKMMIKKPGENPGGDFEVPAKAGNQHRHPIHRGFEMNPRCYYNTPLKSCVGCIASIWLRDRMIGATTTFEIAHHQEDLRRLCFHCRIKHPGLRSRQYGSFGLASLN